MTVTLVCDCCGFGAEFADAEAAFQAGWDAPPHFQGYMACNLCPASYIVMGQIDRHASIHEQWERTGRPAEFEMETCMIPEDRLSPEQLDQARQLAELLRRIRES